MMKKIFKTVGRRAAILAAAALVLGGGVGYAAEGDYTFNLNGNITYGTATAPLTGATVTVKQETINNAISGFITSEQGAPTINSAIDGYLQQKDLPTAIGNYASTDKGKTTINNAIDGYANSTNGKKTIGDAINAYAISTNGQTAISNAAKQALSGINVSITRPGVPEGTKPGVTKYPYKITITNGGRELKSVQYTVEREGTTLNIRGDGDTKDNGRAVAQFKIEQPAGTSKVTADIKIGQDKDHILDGHLLTKQYTLAEQANSGSGTDGSYKVALSDTTGVTTGNGRELASVTLEQKGKDTASVTAKVGNGNNAIDKTFTVQRTQSDEKKTGDTFTLYSGDEKGTKIGDVTIGAATKAFRDGNGEEISETYVKKADVDRALENLQYLQADNSNEIADEAAERESKDNELSAAITQEAQDRSDAVNRLNSRIDKTNKEIDQVGAMSMAIAGLHPLDYDEGDARFQLSAAVGTYDGTQAVALGGFYHFNHDSLLSFGMTTDTSDFEKFGANIGYTRRIGQGGHHQAAVSDGQISDILQDIQALKAKQASLEAENEELKAKLAALQK